MLRRMAALFMLLIMLFSSAQAQEPALPDGVEMLPVFQAGQFDVPEGLEPMYELMRKTGSPNDVFLARMPHGRALLSLSYSQVDHPYTADELLALWPQAEERLRRGAQLLRKRRNRGGRRERADFAGRVRRHVPGWRAHGNLDGVSRPAHLPLRCGSRP